MKRFWRGFGGVAIVDETTAHNIIDESKDPESVTGILIKALAPCTFKRQR